MEHIKKSAKQSLTFLLFNGTKKVCLLRARHVLSYALSSGWCSLSSFVPLDTSYLEKEEDCYRVRRGQGGLVTLRMSCGETWNTDCFETVWNKLWCVMYPSAGCHCEAFWSLFWCCLRFFPIQTCGNLEKKCKNVCRQAVKKLVDVNRQ